MKVKRPFLLLKKNILTRSAGQKYVHSLTRSILVRFAEHKNRAILAILGDFWAFLAPKLAKVKIGESTLRLSMLLFSGQNAFCIKK